MAAANSSNSTENQATQGDVDVEDIDIHLDSGEKDTVKGKKFGTFNGVFRPTILTILGVMMYLREGWVVGNAGLGGMTVIILMAYTITGTAALSISSITTNIRLGAGGVFSIVSQSLGLEVGSSIGIPFYLAQGLSTAMYIYGFMEGWLYIFPDHPPKLVVFAVFFSIFVLSYISTSLAFHVQVIVMFGVILALGSIFLGVEKLPALQRPELWGAFKEVRFWELFAVFFPASTGIMVGASMSGNLKNPRRSIPVGTMAAWGLSLLVYLSMAVWYALVATPAELRDQLTIAVDRSFWGPAVLIGILSSCFSAALSSFIAAPRILQSLGSHNILPFSAFLSKLHKDEPRNAMAFTGALVTVTLVLGDLNAIAKVLTVIFLLTYFTINSIVLIEHRLNLISFRPTFLVSFWVPFLGGLFCLSAILIISPFLGLVALLASASIYVYLNRSDLHYSVETVRSGLFVGIANWAAKIVATGTERNTKRAWKPDLLIPIERRTQFEGLYRLLFSLVYPQGSLQVVSFMKNQDKSPFRGLKELIREVQNEGLYASSAIIDSSDYMSSLETSVAIMKGAFFQPNTIFSLVEGRTQNELQGILNTAINNLLGVILYSRHPEAGLGRGRRINLWIRDQSPRWHMDFELPHIDLALLLGYKLMENWNVRMTVLSVVANPGDTEIAEKYLGKLMDHARIPPQYEIKVEAGSFTEYLPQAPLADLNVFGLGKEIDKDVLNNIVIDTKSSCLFVYSSGRESVLA
ncbi:MAG: Na-K-Cl cotransporter [Proteobacteria bacterium]|nr:Na-K-Cl cotransporter [Pseudomonadota bacterium]